MATKHLRTPDHIALREVILEAREAAGMTQREFAKALGKTKDYVWRIEIGERNVHVLDFVAIARAAGIKPEVLLRRLIARGA